MIPQATEWEKEAKALKTEELEHPSTELSGGEKGLATQNIIQEP